VDGCGDGGRGDCCEAIPEGRSSQGDDLDLDVTDCVLSVEVFEQRECSLVIELHATAEVVVSHWCHLALIVDLGAPSGCRIRYQKRFVHPGGRGSSSSPEQIRTAVARSRALHD
jgi:hypothetical protein